MKPIQTYGLQITRPGSNQFYFDNSLGRLVALAKKNWNQIWKNQVRFFYLDVGRVGLTRRRLLNRPASPISRLCRYIRTFHPVTTPSTTVASRAPSP